MFDQIVDQLTITQALRYVMFMALGIPFAVLAGWSAGWWHRDYGLPWRRRAGSNGKSVVDGVVTLVLGVLAAVALIGAQVGLWRGAWWVVAVTNLLIGLLVVLAWALVIAIWYERRKRRQAGLDQERITRIDRSQSRE